MDYKSRNPILPRWFNDHVDAMRNPMPSVWSCLTDTMELDAPDGSTTFLAFCGECIIDEELLIWYLVEAPLHCKMRQAFEAGEINMEDFWDHKGWLIQMENTVMTTQDPVIKYIHPTQFGVKPGEVQTVSGFPLVLRVTNQWSKYVR